MKTGRVMYNNGKFPNDVRDIVVSDYKDVLNVGNLVVIEGEKYIVVDKSPSKCLVMNLRGQLKRYYYKAIDFMYLTLDTSRDSDVIEFMKKLNLNIYSILDYDYKSNQYKCNNGELHSYSFLFNKYLNQVRVGKI